MTTSTDSAPTEIEDNLSGERRDLLETLHTHRGFLLHTVRGLTDEQAKLRTTVSELCLGGIIKHVAHVEQGWDDFIEHGPSTVSFDEASIRAHADSFRVFEGETLARLVEEFERAARRTDDLVRNVASLDERRPLPDAPWFEPGGSWSVRRVVLHLIAEISQHAGHADVVREALDGSKTMG